MPLNGAHVLIGFDDGTGIAILGSQRDTTITETTDEVDVSSKDSRATRVLPGRYRAELSGESLYLGTGEAGREAYEMLQTAMRSQLPDGEMLTVIVEEEGVYLESASFLLKNLTKAAPDQDAITASWNGVVDGWFVSGT